MMGLERFPLDPGVRSAYVVAWDRVTGPRMKRRRYPRWLAALAQRRARQC